MRRIIVRNNLTIALSSSQAHPARIIPMLLQILPKRLVLRRHPIMRQRANKEKRNKRTQHRQSTAHPERTRLTTALVRPMMREGLDHRWERPCAHKRTDLAHCGCDAIELPTDGRGPRFRGEQTEIVAWPELAEGEEYPVHDGERTNVGLELLVGSGHDEANHRLGEETEDHGVLGAKVVNKKGATDRAGDVEQAVWVIMSDIFGSISLMESQLVCLLDNNIPAENSSEGAGTTSDRVHDGRRVDTKGVRDKIIDELRGLSNK